MEIDESMTFKQLKNLSSDRRKERADNVKYNLPPDFSAGEEADKYIFETKSVPSETGEQYQSSVVFFKPKNPKLPLERCVCKVDCECPDYKYTWAYANKKKGASEVGLDSLSKATNAPPRVNNPRQRTGLCKHLIAIGEHVEGELYKMPGEMDTGSKLDALYAKYKKPIKPLPGMERRKAEIDKARGIKEELNEIKTELLFENVEIRMMDLIDIGQ